MKPVDFELHRPETLTEAVDLLAAHGDDGKVLAGGQSLVPLLNFRLARPGHLIDLGRIASLSALQRTEDGLSIGAMVTHAQAGRSPAVATAAPLMAAAIPFIAHEAIRARGTIGGSIAHADPAAELPAVARALDAVLVVLGPGGVRRIPAEEFFVANLVTALRPDELLARVEILPAGPATGGAFDEIGRRRGDFALVGAGAQISLADDGTICDARLCLTGVASTPHRAAEAEAVLVGRAPTAACLKEAASVTREAVTPTADLHATADYRRDVAGTLLERAVQKAADRAAATSTTSDEGRRAS